MRGHDEEGPSERAEQNRRSMTAGLFLVGAAVFCAGLAIAWMDTRPGWDDTGITAGAVVLVAASGAAGGHGAWLSAMLAVVPILAAELSGGAGVLLAVPMAVLGAAAGSVVRRLVHRPGTF